MAPIGHPNAPGLIAEVSRRYDNPNTRHQYVAELTDLFVAALNCRTPAIASPAP